MNKNTRNILFYIPIWLGLFFIFFSISNYWQPTKYALISATFDTLSLVGIYYLNVSLLYPRFYNNQAKYLSISLLLVAIISIGYTYVDMFLIPREADVSHETPPFVMVYMRFLMVNGFTFFIGTSFSLMKQTARLQENEKLLTEEKLQTELKLLKAQINPHFIFNALNNIYSLTYMQAKNAPDAVLKLSEMLRYVFYDCNKERVSLQSEIKYIENFIGFQQMKSEHQQNIKLSMHQVGLKDEIAPMLFIPFIENAFKYSRIEEMEESYVHMEVSIENKSLFFSIENSVDANNKPLAGSGMGIKNVQHRLEIIYPDMHNLTIQDEPNRFLVTLKVDL